MSKRKTVRLTERQFKQLGRSRYQRICADKPGFEKRHRGKTVAIEVRSGDYVIGDTLSDADNRACRRFPKVRLCFFRHVGPWRPPCGFMESTRHRRRSGSRRK